MNAWQDIVAFATVIAIGGCMVWLQWRRDRHVRWLVEQSFRRVSFASDGVPLTGADLVVVKKVQHFIGTNYDATFVLDGEAMNGSNAFWYCSGPGARWFLAIPSVSKRDDGVGVRWVVRPLTEQRMRAVLRFDRQAYRRTFGTLPD